MGQKHYCGHPDCTGDAFCPMNQVCVCGMEMASHGLYDGHSPVSMHEYSEQLPTEEQPNGKTTDSSDDHR